MYDHIDLFSGIGGFSLAARWSGVETRVFCELDPFCQRVLKKHWPDVPIIPDVRAFNGYEHKGAWLLTGGFPCQPFSCAGKRKGKDDTRFLWPEMCRVIREAQPEWVLAENVSGLLSQDGGLVFEHVLTDLEDAGYETLPLVIPACGVGAPHRRDRVWIVSHSKTNGDSGRSGKIYQEDGRQDGRMLFGSYHADCHAHNAELSGCKGSAGRTQAEQDSDRQNNGLSEQTDSHAADTRCFRQTVSQEQAAGIKQCFTRNTERGQLAWAQDGGLSGRQSAYSIGSHWNEPWLEVATRLCRVDARVSSRVDRLKALGNSIVPQIAGEIIRAMKEVK